MFQFLSKSRALDQFKSRSPIATPKPSQGGCYLGSIKEALSEATTEQTGLKTRIDDVLHAPP
jgi:hypothetical protein